MMFHCNRGFRVYVSEVAQMDTGNSFVTNKKYVYGYFELLYVTSVYLHCDL